MNGMASNMPAANGQRVSFQQDVQPLLNARCVACHGGTAGLYLDSYNGVMNGGAGWPIVVPGDPANSRLVQVVSSGDMPYGGPPLTASEIQTLVNWIVAGAPDN